MCLTENVFCCSIGLWTVFRMRTYHCRFLAMGKNKTNKNISVQNTNDSSILSKKSMIQQGYFKDNYLQYFAAKDVRRAPLINRGYYIRMMAVEHVMKAFLTSARWKTKTKQIVSLGAGFDTSFFRFQEEGLLSNTVFFEVDFHEVVAEKSTSINNNPELSTAVGDTQPINNQLLNTVGIRSHKYRLFSCDLKDIPRLENCLLHCGIDKSRPTLLLSEVVLAYLDPKSSTGVIKWASQFFSSALFATYEQVYPHDSFGAIMMKHFKSISSPLRSMETYSDPKKQIHRYTENGWTEVLCRDMNQFYFDVLQPEEKSRIEHLEPFDEFEEWQLKCAHYVMMVALKGSCELLKDELFSESHVRLSDQEPSEALGCVVATNSVGGTLQRYGHSACQATNDEAILLYGGFGLKGTKHMRLGDVHILYRREGSWVSSQALVDDPDCVIGARMFHTATKLNDGRIFVYGGRTSPTNPCTLSFVFRVEKIIKDPVSVFSNKKEISTGKGFCTPYQVNIEEKATQRSNKSPQDGSFTFSAVNTSAQEANLSLRTQVTRAVSPVKEQSSTASLVDNISVERETPDSYSCSTADGTNRSIAGSANDCHEKRPCTTITSHAIASGGCVTLPSADGETNEGHEVVDTDCAAVPVTNVSCHETSHQRSDAICKEYKVSCVSWECHGDVPPPRWRHTTTSVVLQDDKEGLLVFGGRTLHSEPLGDCYCLDVTTRTWNQVPLDGDKVEPRHSHSACHWGRSVVLAGGLGENLVPLSTVQVVETQVSPMQLRSLNIEPALEPRYSHTAHVLGNNLLLLGGVTPFYPGPPSLAIVDLNSLTWRSYSLPLCCQPSSLVLLHNHCSLQVGPQKIMVLGGGGNCFSFGSYLNKEPIIIELPM